MPKIHFTQKDILDKDFNQKFRGYDATQVDTFLDKVISDYQTFGTIIDQLRQQNDNLRNQIATASPQANTMNNKTCANILQRLDKLSNKLSNN